MRYKVEFNGRAQATLLVGVLGVVCVGGVLLAGKQGWLPGSRKPGRVDRVAQLREARELAAQARLPMSYKELFPPYVGDPADNAALWLGRLKPLADHLSPETRASLQRGFRNLTTKE